MPERGACPPLNISDYIDHLALTQGFTYLNNLRYSLTSLALAMLACLQSLLVNARVCSKPSTRASQEMNHQARKQSQKKKMGLGDGGGGGYVCGITFFVRRRMKTK